MRFTFPAALLLAAGCADWSGSFTTRFAPAFAPAGHSVSVLAVYKEGHMSSAEWERLSPALAADFEGGSCEAGYEALVAAHPDLASVVDERAREDGPTDELLAELAPAAQGDLILVITEADRLSPRLAPKPGGPTQRGPSNVLPAFMTSGSRRSRGPDGAPVMPGRDTELPGDAAESHVISALFYSVQQKQSVAEVSLQYTGTELDRALAELAQKLGASMPAMRCAAWAWDANLEPAPIPPSEEEQSL